VGYFESVVEQQYVRPSRGISFHCEPEGAFWIVVTVHRDSSELEWPEMIPLLEAWARAHECNFDQLVPAHKGLPHLWEATFKYHHVEKTVEQACALAEDAIGFVRALTTGQLSRADLAAILREGNCSVLVGMTESQVLDAKKTLKLDTDINTLELAKDMCAMANSKDWRMYRRRGRSETHWQ
jgi:hypothetical protein